MVCVERRCVQNPEYRLAQRRNPDLGFVKRKEVNVGFEASLFKRFVTMNANFYINRMEGMPVQPSTVYPVWFSTGWPSSSFIPYVNYNIDRRMGIDFAVNFNKKFGEFDLALGLTGNYLTTEAIKRDELYEDTYRNRVGRPIDSLWGLESAGFYESEEGQREFFEWKKQREMEKQEAKTE